MNDFWAIIDQARGASGDPMTPSTNPSHLKEVLSKKSDEEVHAFGIDFYHKLVQLNHWNLWAAGYVIAGGMSDDSFHYFRSWIIGKGKACFDMALSNPDDLASFIDDAEVDNEALEYVAVEILEGRGKPDPREELGELSVDEEPEGEPFDEDDVEDRFPKLAALA